MLKLFILKNLIIKFLIFEIWYLNLQRYNIKKMSKIEQKGTFGLTDILDSKPIR